MKRLAILFVDALISAVLGLAIGATLPRPMPTPTVPVTAGAGR